MKRIFALALAVAAAMPAAFASDIGVSVEISQPGVFGRIDIGRFPQPAVIVPSPVIIEPPPVVHVQPQPIYLWVPPGHRKNWRRHCREYNACGVPVYFVRHDWYDRHVRYARVDRDDNDDDRGRRFHRGGEYKEKFHDGVCKVEREWKDDGSYKEERECKATHGSRHGRGAEREEKYRNGPCEVEREWKRDGSYKEKIECDR